MRYTSPRKFLFVFQTPVRSSWFPDHFLNCITQVSIMLSSYCWTILSLVLLFVLRRGCRFEMKRTAFRVSCSCYHYCSCVMCSSPRLQTGSEYGAKCGTASFVSNKCLKEKIHLKLSGNTYNRTRRGSLQTVTRGGQKSYKMAEQSCTTSRKSCGGSKVTQK